MRKEAKNKINTLSENALMRYHEGRTNDQDYIQEGFNKIYFYNSDRPILLDDNYNNITNNQIVAGFGLEIEQGNIYGLPENACVAINRKLIFDNLHKDLFKYQRDGSIDGVEAITQIMSKSFLRNNYNKFIDAFELLKVYGLTPDEKCGMHINISRALLGTTPETQLDNAKKLLYVIHHHYNYFCHLYGRTSNFDYCEYCSRYNNINFVKEINEGDLLCITGHYTAVNFGHFNYCGGRVELRIPGGRKTGSGFIKSCELTFALLDYIKSTKRNELDNLAKFESIYNKNADLINDKLELRGFNTLNYIQTAYAEII